MELMERRRILLNTPHTNIVTGLQFVTDMVAPLGSLVVGLSPTQSGTGDPSPTNVRPISGRENLTLNQCGKNLFNYENCNFISGIRDSNGEYQSDNNSGYTANPTPVNPSTSYTLSGSKLYYTGIVVRVYYLDENGDWISRTGGTQGNVVNFTTPSNCYFIQIQTRFAGTDTSTWQLEVGSEATAYEEYHKQTHAVSWGKNLYNPAATNVGYISASGTITVDANFRYTDLIPVTVGETYTFSATNAFSGTAVKRIHGYNVSGNWVEQLGNTSARERYSVSITIPSGIAYVRISAPTADTDKQFERGSVATNYEPYKGGYVYGGTVDFVTGVLTVDKKFVIVNSISTVAANYIKSDAVDGYVTVSEIYPSVGPASQPLDLVADRLNFINRGIWSAVGFPNRWTINATQIHINVANDLLGITDYTQETTTTAKEKLNTWLANNPVTLTIPITPVTYQLTPQQVLSLKGVNNLSLSAQVKFWTHRD